MGKIKSAVITAIVALATLALFLFGVVSCGLPGGVNRYNSILASIHLGSELSGDAYAVLLPEGVITAEEYEFTVTEETGDKAAEYRDSYTVAPGGSYYVKNTVLDDYAADGSADTSAEVASAFEAFEKDVQADAVTLAARFSDRNLTSYSVGVLGGCAIRVAVPTNFSYASYSGSDTTTRSSDLNVASAAISYITLGGELTLRNNEYGTRDKISAAQNASGSSTVTRNIISASLEVEELFESVQYYAMGGTYAVKVNLTEAGREEISRVSAIIADTEQVSDQTIRFYVGETSVINLTCESQLTESSFFIQANDEATARNYAALLNSVATGNALGFEYSYDEVIYTTAAGGADVALFLAIAALISLVALMAFSVSCYKKLGLTFSLMALLFSSAMIAIVYLVGTTLTMTGVFTAFMCLALFAGCNFFSFEQIRKETRAGRTIQASVKLGYKKTLTGILDTHIVLLIISVILALVCTGEAAACGMILLIGTLASYILHWFTRFMWYVTMSPARDKYKFCGFKREAIEDYE